MTSVDLPSDEQIISKQGSVGIFCDFQNVSSIKKFASLLLEFAESKGRVVDKRLYYNSQRKGELSGKNILEPLGFQGIDVPDKSKNSADRKLMTNCIELVAFNRSLKTVILILGDKDFAPLVSFLKSLKKQVIIFGRKDNISKKLMNLAGHNQVHYIEELPQLVGKIRQEKNSLIPQINYHEAVDYLIEAITTALEKGKRTVLSYIDQLMRKLFPKYQGFSSICRPNGKKFKNFSQFVDSAVREGKIRKQNQELLLIE